jgi:hypothetical protein
MSHADRPLCFVVMPFGAKPDPRGGPDIDFNRIYEAGIRPAIEDAGMEPCRADGELAGGLIDQAMYERIVLAEYVVADLSTINPNVMYELGVRHMARPATTLPIFAIGHALPFDVSHTRGLPYQLGAQNVLGDAEAAALRTAVGDRLKALRAEQQRGELRDSPVYQLLRELRPPDVERLRTDSFRERTRFAEEVRARLAQARAARDSGVVDAIERAHPTDHAETGVLVDLLQSWRALGQAQRMVDLVEAARGRRARARELLGAALAARPGLAEAVGLCRELGESCTAAPEAVDTSR